MWYIVYTYSPKYESVSRELEALGIRHFVPIQYEWNQCGGSNCQLARSHPYRNLIFVQTDGDIVDLVKSTGCLVGIYHDRAGSGPAKISDAEMEVYLPVLTNPDSEILYFDTPYDELDKYPEVYVAEGKFANWKGRAIRVHRKTQRERRLLINLASLSVVIGGIPYTSLRPIGQ